MKDHGVSLFVSIIPLDYFCRDLGTTSIHFLFVITEPDKTEHDLFLTLTKQYLCLKPNQTTVLLLYKIEN